MSSPTTPDPTPDPGEPRDLYCRILAAGWPTWWIAEQCGFKRRRYVSAYTFTADDAAALRFLYDGRCQRLATEADGFTAEEITGARRAGQKQHAHPPFAYDDLGNLIPSAVRKARARQRRQSGDYVVDRLNTLAVYLAEWTTVRRAGAVRGAPEWNATARTIRCVAQPGEKYKTVERRVTRYAEMAGMTYGTTGDPDRDAHIAAVLATWEVGDIDSYTAAFDVGVLSVYRLPRAHPARVKWLADHPGRVLHDTTTTLDAARARRAAAADAAGRRTTTGDVGSRSHAS